MGYSVINGIEQGSVCKNPKDSQRYEGHTFCIFNFLISYTLQKFSKFQFLLFVSYIFLYS